MKYILRFLIFVHRWVGIALCVIFLLWFPSGIGMMYWGFPGVSGADRLDHSPKLDPAKIVLSPEEAAEKAGLQANPTQIRLNTFDGRPVYRFGGFGERGGGRAGRGGGGKMIYADTGEEQTEASVEMLDRIASRWTGRPFSEATKVSVEEPDQWTVAGNFRNLRPMYKYSWPDGQQVYLNGMTGEVVQYTTFAARVAAHVSAIPHWIYYTPVRKYQAQWLQFMIWSSVIGTIGAIIGIVVAVWMYSPKKRYRLKSQPTGIPYKGQKRWHWIFGMVFGVATVTWTFSGLMTLGPFPIVQRLTQPAGRAGQRGTQPPETRQPEEEQSQQQAAPAQPNEAGGGSAQRSESQPTGGRQNNRPQATVQQTDGQPDAATPRGVGRGGRNRGRNRGSDTPIAGERAERIERGSDATDDGQTARNRTGPQSGGTDRSSNAAVVNQDGSGENTGSESGGGRRGGGRGGQQAIAGALRGRVRMTDFASVHPRDLLAKVPNLDVKELEWTSFAGMPLFNVNLGSGKSQLLSLDGAPVNGFDVNRIVGIVKAVVPDPNALDIKVIDQYDLYYLDRTRQRPLPVIRVLTNDDEKTRYYIDPKSARVVSTYSNRNWVNRWLDSGLHSLSFPFLYNHRPLWDIVVITFMVGGTALCVTSLVLAWRTLGRKLKRISVDDMLPRVS